MAERVIILTGPPGAGKSTAAAALVSRSRARAAAHLHSDDFFDYIAHGFIKPWLPESADQNRAISHALAAAACAYAQGGIEVVMDGVVGPWFLDIYRLIAADTRTELHYVVLRPDLETAVVRARDRIKSPLSDYPPRIYEGLAHLG